jgi:hypothetical protein
VGAPRALKSDEIDLGHDSMSYITNRDIPQLFVEKVLTKPLEGEERRQ